MKAVDDQVVLVTLIDSLVDDSELIFLNQLLLIEVSTALVSFLDLLSDLLAQFFQSDVLVS